MSHPKWLEDSLARRLFQRLSRESHNYFAEENEADVAVNSFRAGFCFERFGESLRQNVAALTGRAEIFTVRR